MSNVNDKSSPLEALEQKLGAFVPAPARVERDRLMFFAGRASAERKVVTLGAWGWQAATSFVGATAIALAVALVTRPDPREVIVYRDGPGPATTIAAVPRRARSAVEDFHVMPEVITRPAVSRVPADNYLRTREVAVRMGLDAIGSQGATSGISAPPTYLDLLLGLAGSRRGSEGAAERRENPSNM